MSVGRRARGASLRRGRGGAQVQEWTEQKDRMKVALEQNLVYERYLNSGPSPFPLRFLARWLSIAHVSPLYWLPLVRPGPSLSRASSRAHSLVLSLCCVFSSCLFLPRFLSCILRSALCRLDLR